jgi:hypothetical protein
MKLYSAIWLTLFLPVSTPSTLVSEPSVREVFTSQRLFVTKLVPVKGKFNKTKQGYKAELRDAFKVIRYENDSSYVELDWTLCPDGHCPEVGEFSEGSTKYREIDSLIKSLNKTTKH